MTNEQDVTRPPGVPEETTVEIAESVLVGLTKEGKFFFKIHGTNEYGALKHLAAGQHVLSSIVFKATPLPGHG